MEIIAKFQIDRTGGKTESRENVEAEFLDLLQQDLSDFDVEDSTYEITDVDIIESAKASGPKGNLGAALALLADRYFDARPVVINMVPRDDPAWKPDAVRNGLTDPEQKLDNAIFHLLNEASTLINKARQDAAKAARKG